MRIDAEAVLGLPVTIDWKVCSHWYESTTLSPRGKWAFSYSDHLHKVHSSFTTLLLLVPASPQGVSLPHSN